MTTPVKHTPRRVLGDIAPKAMNTPSKQPGTALTPPETTRKRSPLKQVSIMSPQVFVNKENAMMEGAHSQGKKRRIFEVDDVETADRAKAMFGARDEGKAAWKDALTAHALEMQNESNPVNLPPPGSPTERNSPTPEPAERPEAPQEQGLSQESNTTSFSNWLNYDLCASQKTELPPARSSSPPPVEEKKSRAQLLRTTLALGMYKVKTNQTAKRSSDIISSWESSSPELPTSNLNTTSAESLAPLPVPSITLSRADAHANAPRNTNPNFASIKVSLDPGRPIGKLSITPATVLLPTSYSSRNAQSDNITSSPPSASVAPEQLMSPVKSRANYATPSRRARVQYDDDGRAEPLEDRIQRMRDLSSQESLTSSAVKGHAAKGLLDLMKAGR